MKKLKMQIFATLIILLSLNTNAGTVAFVGPSSDSNCDFDSIQGAVDSGATDMYISTAMQYNENLILPNTNSDVNIRGGYTDCSQSSFDSTLKSAVSGHLEDAPVLIILPSSESKTIVIRNMFFVNGTGAAFVPAGGINMAGSNDTLTLLDTIVGLNVGFIGGGIYIGTSAGATFDDRPFLFIFNSLIINNSSTSETFGGGGIFCENGGISIHSNSSIKRNITEGSGGGIYADGCNVSEWSGTLDQNDAEQGIFDNKAKIHGGGIFATNSSTIQIGTASVHSRLFGSVINNIADSDNNGEGDGGGIYASDSSVNLYGSIVMGNRSGGNGGGIYAENGTTVTASRQSDMCWTGYKCNQISNNHASSSNGNGGGMYFTNTGFGIIETAYFEGNRADNGTAIYTTSEFSDTVIQNSTFFKNGNNGADGFNDNNVIMTNNNSSILSVFNTFLNNNETVSTFRTQNDSYLVIQGNIIYSNTAVSAFRSANAFPVIVDCVNTNLLPLAGTDVFNTAITYVDEANGDLRLSGADEGAIDKCIDYGISTDGEGDERPYDNPQVVNLAGSSDVGSDEYADLIFKDGFE